ncbi:MAG: MaoC/PaaZ C-terminal domain-containing protein [Vicinamibacteria bacterium]
MQTVARTFTAADVEAFAAASGDWNPAHVDPLAARRLIAGGPIVHGLHALLWALDGAAAGPGLARVRCTFRQPVRVGERATATPHTGGDGTLEIAIQSGGRDALEAAVEWGPAQPEVAVRTAPARAEPELLTADDIASAQGALDVASGDLHALLPGLAGRLSAGALAALVSVSRLVGMQCPGRFSILRALDLRFDGAAPGPTLRWRVLRFDPRFSSVRIGVEAGGFEGTVDAFLAPAPSVQPGTADLGALVERGAFADARALVVGGSRGLGEVAAKLLAAGGADVRVTYRDGVRDAGRVCDDIRAAGFRAEPRRLDVLDPEAPAGLGGWRPSHLLYFATPHIALAESARFSAELFRRYGAYYVEGFVRLVEAIAADGAPLAAFYPSTAALDEIQPKALEYASAKAAGEAACRHLERLYPRLRVEVIRLPRVRTDATATVMPVEAAEAATVMRDVLRRLRAAPRAEDTAAPR